MSKRSLFVSFAESDGGHSYLATRSMLDANSIGHLIFRTTVSDALDAVTSGQANFAVVPLYNSITQWEGPTLKALGTGQYEIFAQVCTPTSYVLAAHREYMQAIVDRYQQLSDKEEKLSPERAKKIYTRFLTRIFVGSQAEEQYRGRLLRPDMAQATVEHSRNPLRVLEEIARNELMNELKSGTPRSPRTQGNAGFGGSIILDYPVRQASISELNVPATLIAAGLLDMQQDPDGWDRHGSVGEIVSLLRNLLELLDVYAFGAPDLPENKTQYVLVGRKGASLPAGALRLPAGAPPTRVMTMVRSNYKKSSSDQWLKPREALSKDIKDFGIVLDRAPIMVSNGPNRVFLLEGGRVNAHGKKPSSATGLLGASSKKKKKSLREAVEAKPTKKPDSGSPEDFSRVFLGEYQTWCPMHSGAPGETCSCCDEAFEESKKVTPWPWEKILPAALVTTFVALGIALLAYALFYCSLTGKCDATNPPDSYHPPAAVVTPPATTTEPAAPSARTTHKHTPAPKPAAPEARHSTTQAYPGVPDHRTEAPTGYPGLPSTHPAGKAPTTAAPVPATPARPVVRNPPATTPARPPVQHEAEVRPIVLHVAFMEAKSNLTRETYNTLTAAASHAMQLNRTVDVRIFALGQRETDSALWQRRLYAVKDELVRLGVPVERIRSEGTGPYMLVIRGLEPVQPHSSRERTRSDLDTVSDPLANE